MEPWKRRKVRKPNRTRKQLQWGHGDGAVEEAIDLDDIEVEDPPGFNGATAMEPWKR